MLPTSRKPTKRLKSSKSKPAQRASRKRLADRLFGQVIRWAGYCEAMEGRIECKGPLQCAHIFSRRYHAVRWNEVNALSLCAGHHTYWTHRPDEWWIWIHENFPGRLRYLREVYRDPWDRDIESVIERLQGRMHELEERSTP